MSDRAGCKASRRETRKPSRGMCRPQFETLEGRQVLNASLAALPNISVPLYLGDQVPLNGSGSNAPTQTYTVTSSNSDIKATVAQGKFLTLNVSHAASSTPGDVSFGVPDPVPITFQLFDDLTPITTSKIEGFTSSGFYNGKNFHRVANMFPGATDFIVQGGSASGNGSGNSGQPGTPFADEFVQQLAFTGTGQLAMANAGPNTNDTQFFVTTGTPTFLDFKHTIFGQVVSGADVINQMTQVSKGADGTTPVSPIIINTATLSDTNPNGVVHIDATQARVGETSVINVTATDPTTGTTATKSFQVVVAQNPGATTLPLDLKPIAFSASQTYSVNTPQTIQLAGDPANSATQANQTLSFALKTQPTHGTISQFDPAKGTLVYTPNTNSQDTDSFQFIVTNSGAKLTSDPSTVSLTTIAVSAPLANPVTQDVPFGVPTTIQLAGSSQNPGSNQAIKYTLVSLPTQGTISNFDGSKGTLVYTPSTTATGTDTFQYVVTNDGPPAPGLISDPGTVTVNLIQAPIDTGAVRQVGRVLVVTPQAGAFKGKNTITIRQTSTPSNPSAGNIIVTVNGHPDIFQPAAVDIDRIVAYGSKAGDTITVDPSVDPFIAVTLDGGHGRHRSANVLTAGDGPTREHGWFGRNTLIGGSDVNELIGRAGHVKFRPTATTDVIFAGMAHPFEFSRGGRRIPPTGTFYKLVKKKLVPIATPPLQPDFQDVPVPHRHHHQQVKTTRHHQK